MSDSYFLVVLPSGQKVNIMTKEGADAFLEHGTSDFITRNLTHINTAREKLANARSNTERRSLQDQLYCSYALWSCIADNASSAKFEHHVPQKDLKALTDHACGVFSKLTGAETWKRTGVLAKHDQELLESFILLNKYVLVSKLIVNPGSVMEHIAKLCSVRQKPNMFGAPVAEAVLSIVNNAQITLQGDGLSTAKIFKCIEATGILAQVFRAFTAPPIHEGEHRNHLRLWIFWPSAIE